MILTIINYMLASIACGAFRALHGEAIINKLTQNLVCTLVVLLILGFKFTILYNPITVYLGFALGYSIGWGKYFMSFHGMNLRHEKEFAPIDFIVDKISNNYLSGIVGMSLRWFIFFLPLALVTGSLITSPILLSVGFIYHSLKYVGTKYFNRIEFITGMLPLIMVLLSI